MKVELYAIQFVWKYLQINVTGDTMLDENSFLKQSNMKVEEPFASKVVLFRCKIQETCKRTAELCKWLLDFDSNEYITQTMCKKLFFLAIYICLWLL